MPDMDSMTPMEQLWFLRAVRDYRKWFGYSVEVATKIFELDLETHDIEFEARRLNKEAAERAASWSKPPKPDWLIDHENIEAGADPAHDMIATTSED